MMSACVRHRCVRARSDRVAGWFVSGEKFKVRKGKKKRLPENLASYLVQTIKRSGKFRPSAPKSMQPATVCTFCGDCPRTSTWHGFAMPYGTNWYRNISCEAASELGVSHAWLPVVHTYDLHQKWRLPGLWLYYARGCSDILWNVGRTLLALNKFDAGVLLLQRQAKAQRRGGSGGSSGGGNGDGGGGRTTTRHAQLAFNRDVWAGVSGPARKLIASVLQLDGGGSGGMSYELALRTFTIRLLTTNGMLISLPRAHDSVHARAKWAVHADQGPLRDAIAEAAKGFYGSKEQCNPHPVSAQLVRNETLCRGACLRRAIHLRRTLVPYELAIEAVLLSLMLELVGTDQQLDSLQLLQQPAGGGSILWTTEIWDMRSLSYRRAAAAHRAAAAWRGGDGGAKGASRFARLDDAPCVPSATFELCMACNGSELHRRCEWRDRQAWCARKPPKTGRRAFQCGGTFRNASAVYAGGLPLGPPPAGLRQQCRA